MARGSIRKRIVGDGDPKKRANVRYDVIYRADGKQVWRTFRKKDAAEAHLNAVCPEIQDGTHRQLKEGNFRSYVEGDWAETHLALAKLKASTIRGYRTIISAYLLPEFGNHSFKAIDSTMIEGFQTRLIGSGRSKKTVHNAMTLLGRILNNARKDRYLKVSPMLDVKKTDFSCRKGRALNPGEVERLLGQCDSELRLIVLLGLLAGLRRSEILALHWVAGDPDAPHSYIDFDADKIRIRETVQFLSRAHGQVKPDQEAWQFVSPKSDAGVRDIPLSPRLKVELQKNRLQSADKEGLIFHTASGHPLNPSNVYKRWFQPAVRRAEIDRVTLHHLRHTYGSVLRDQGTDMYDIMTWMGHSSIQVTIDTYGHPVRDHGKEAADKADAFFFGAV